MKRGGCWLATAALVVAHVVLAANSAGADTPGTTLTVTPATGLVSPAVVTLNGTGFAANAPVAVAECLFKPSLELEDCADLGTFTSNASGAFGPVQVTVTSTFTSPEGRSSDCIASPTCTVFASDETAGKNVHASITFSTAPPLAPVPPSVFVSDVDVQEANTGATTAANFTVSLSANPSAPVSVTIATFNNGTASTPADYTALGPTVLTWNPGGPLHKTVTVTVVGDLLKEGYEFFSLRATNPSGVSLGDSIGVGTIIDTDGRLYFNVADVSVTEGGAGAMPTVNFTVALSGTVGANQTATVMVVTANGTATAGTDYTALPSTTLTWVQGDPTSKVLSITVNGDAVDEPNETFALNLSNATGAIIADAAATAVIVDDDGGPAVAPLPTVRITDLDTTEGNSGSNNANFIVSLSANPSPPVSITVATVNGTALAGSDYTALAPTVLTWNAGDPLNKTLQVGVLGDTVKEGLESFSVNLSSPIGVVRADAVGTATIIDNDGRLFISVSDASAIEGAAAATTSLSFTVSLSAPVAAGQTVSVTVATANGTASAGSDYVARAPTVLTWVAGDPVAKTVSVTVNGDAADEPNETFMLNLTAGTGAAISDIAGTATVVDDD